MPVPQRDWIDLFYAFGPTAAVLVALIIGATQLYLQRQQLIQGLYEKRLAFYKAFSENYGRVLSRDATGSAPLDALGRSPEFYQDGYHCSFLFGKEVVELVQRFDAALRDYMQQMQFEKRLKSETGKTLEQLFKDWTDIFGKKTTDVPPKTSDQIVKELTNLLLEGRAAMVPYLQLHYDRWWPGRLFDRINRWMDSDIPAKLATRNHD